MSEPNSVGGELIRSRPSYLLNLSFKKLGSVLSRARTVVLTFIVVRTLAGRLARKTRHVLEGFLKGLNLVVTSVICLVIIIEKWRKTAGKNQLGWLRAC